MGLIVNDTYTASNGVEKAGVYISFNSETVYLRKENDENKYNVRANYRVYWDKQAKDAGKQFVELNSVSVSIPAEDLGSNLFACLYAEIKKKYVNSTDSI